MIEKFSTVRVLIQIVEAERPNGPHCYYDQELEICWKDDLSLQLEKVIGNGREPAYKGKKVETDPQEFITLLRGLADQIEFQVENGGRSAA